MYPTEEMARAILADRLREARQLRLVKQALRARKGATGRGQRSEDGDAASSRWGAFTRALRASGRA